MLTLAYNLQNVDQSDTLLFRSSGAGLHIIISVNLNIFYSGIEYTEKGLGAALSATLPSPECYAVIISVIYMQMLV